MLSLTGALREANQDLKNQLRRERQEERRKMLQRVVNAKLDDSGGNNAMDRWRKVLEASSPITPNAPGQTSEPDEEKIKARRELLARIMKKALRKSSNTSDDDSQCHAGEVVGDDGDETDTEQHEQLPHDQETSIEKRTPIKHKRSHVHLNDDRKPECLQLQQPPQQQSRKLSFTRMRDIVEMSRRRPSEQLSEDSKLIKSTVVEEKSKKKYTKPDEKTMSHDDDYNKMNVVSERRALRRQQNARESEGSLQMSLPDSANYDIVNEKNKITEKQHATKTKSPPPMSISPEIFKFDSNAECVRDYSSSRDVDESDTDQTSYKEITQDTVVKRKGQLSKDSSSSLSKNATPTTSYQIHSAKEREPIASTNVAMPRGCVDHRKEQTPPQQSPSPSEKLKPSDDILNKPIRKLNSFLALVREAVAAKKQEQHNVTGDDTNQQQYDLQSRVKNYIDDSNSVSMSESVKTTTETSTTSSKNATYFESIRRKRHQEPPKPKRQDSQGSIWSENIPQILISKSESDECILEKDSDEQSDEKCVKHKAQSHEKKNI